jgi:type IV pilus assembly protein PilA
MIKKQKGFSLIELLIVVAIILIIAAIAIPNLLRARIAANEAAAVGTLRTMNTASVTYSSTWQNGFPPSLASMVSPGAANATCTTAGLLDNILAQDPATKAGYTFVYKGGIAYAPTACGTPGWQTYAIDATPLTVGTTGQRSFCTDESGVIHYDATGAGMPNTDTGCEAVVTVIQ